MAKKKIKVAPPAEEAWEQEPLPAAVEPTKAEDWSTTESVPAENWDSGTKTVSVEIQIETHTGTFNAENAKILIYGESGTGKTRLASTFPQVIFADMDHGMASVTEHVEVVRIDENEFRKLETLYQYLKTGNHQYRTVVLDTLNEMQRFTMGATVEEFQAVRRAYNDLPSQSDYGKMLHDMIELTRKFIDLPMQVVLLAQVNSRVFDTDTLQPQLIGKNTSREICRKMDVIGYIYKSEKDNPDYPGKKLSEIAFDAAEYVTKDRSFKLPGVLTDPSYNRISSFWK